MFTKGDAIKGALTVTKEAGIVKDVVVAKPELASAIVVVKDENGVPAPNFWRIEAFGSKGMLRAENLGHCLKLLHFHIGSQVPDILTVKKAVQEISRFYAKLYKMGFQIEFLDDVLHGDLDVALDDGLIVAVHRGVDRVLDHVAVDQPRPLDARAVDVGAVEAA